MAAPHVCGCVALMISGAMAKGLSWTPFSVKKSLENTAVKLANVEFFAQGHGLVQVSKHISVLRRFKRTFMIMYGIEN